MKYDDYAVAPQAGRFVKEDGSVVNLADLQGAPDDAAATDPDAKGSVIGVLKGLLKRLQMEALLTATIASSASLSDVVTIPDGCKYFQIYLPAAWTAADLAFVSSPTVGGTYGDLVTEADVRIVFTVTAGNVIGIDFSAPNLAACRFIKLESVTVGTPGTPVNQGAERIIYISAKS